MTTSTELGSAHALLADLPRLHHWGGDPQVGGLNTTIGERLIAEVGRFGSPRVIETGAGATTLLFCALGVTELTTIAPDAALQQRVIDEASRRAIATTALDFVCEPSEAALPRLAAAGHRVDVALIDGHHGWPNVFVDFCYFNMMLGAGATLLVDDVQLYSVAQLALLLVEEPTFELVAVDDKLATFRKVADAPSLPDWRHEPFIERLTREAPSAVDVLRARLAGG